MTAHNARNDGPLGKCWADIGSDASWIDYGGCWARHISGTRYHVIQFENCEDWGDGATGYHASLSEVDVDNPQLTAAMTSCGVEDAAREIRPDQLHWCQCQALHSYGAKAPLWQQSGTNAHKLLRAARAESRLLERDSEAYEERMARPVNAIGTSARNYGRGKIFKTDEVG